MVINVRFSTVGIADPTSRKFFYRQLRFVLGDDGNGFLDSDRKGVGGKVERTRK